MIYTLVVDIIYEDVAKIFASPHFSPCEVNDAKEYRRYLTLHDLMFLFQWKLCMYFNEVFN